MNEYNPGAAAWRLAVEMPYKAISSIPEGVEHLAGALERATTGSYDQSMSDMDPPRDSFTHPDMVKDAFDLGSTVAGAGSAAPAPKGSLRAFSVVDDAGERVRARDLHMQALEDGLSQRAALQKLWNEKKMFLDADHRVKYEIPDPAIQDLWRGGIEKGSPLGRAIDPYGKPEEYRFGDVINHPELYDVVPELEDFTLRLGYDPLGGGSFNGKARTIEAFGPNIKDLTSTIVHEAGAHAPAHFRGGDSGSNPRWLQVIYDKLEKGANLGVREAEDALAEIFPEAKGRFGATLDRMPVDTKYRLNAGELSARNAQYRYDMTPEERLATSPSVTMWSDPTLARQGKHRVWSNDDMTNPKKIMSKHFGVDF